MVLNLKEPWKKYISGGPNVVIERPLSTQERILKKLGLKPLFKFSTMGGTYRMEGIINARKYFANNKFAKLHRVADGIELKVQKAKKEIRRELKI